MYHPNWPFLSLRLDPEHWHAWPLLGQHRAMLPMWCQLAFVLVVQKFKKVPTPQAIKRQIWYFGHTSPCLASEFNWLDLFGCLGYHLLVHIQQGRVMMLHLAFMSILGVNTGVPTTVFTGSLVFQPKMVWCGVNSVVSCSVLLYIWRTTGRWSNQCTWSLESSPVNKNKRILFNLSQAPFP